MIHPVCCGTAAAWMHKQMWKSLLSLFSVCACMLVLEVFFRCRCNVTRCMCTLNKFWLCTRALTFRCSPALMDIYIYAVLIRLPKYLWTLSRCHLSLPGIALIQDWWSDGFRVDFMSLHVWTHKPSSGHKYPQVLKSYFRKLNVPP